MRYSADHKQQTQVRLLESSARLIKKEGVGSVGVDGLMKAIGLSGGAFYSHFPSKSDLFSAIVERELTQSFERLNGGQSLSHAQLDKCLKQYLSLAHVENVEAGCALPALGAEIARADEAVRKQAEHWICQLHASWTRTLGCEQLAWAVLSQCVGALVIARMMVSVQARSEVLQASYATLSQQVAETKGGQA
jgi:TetR/AcrR family transcriptional repressor of nem operon